MYRAWWLVCKDTEFFLEEKKQVLFSERKLTLHGFTTEVGSTLNMYIYINTHMILGVVSLLSFSFFFFITCSHMCFIKTLKVCGHKTLPIIQALGDQFQ